MFKGITHAESNASKVIDESRETSASHSASTGPFYPYTVHGCGGQCPGCLKSIAEGKSKTSEVNDKSGSGSSSRNASRGPFVPYTVHGCGKQCPTCLKKEGSAEMQQHDDEISVPAFEGQPDTDTGPDPSVENAATDAVREGSTDDSQVFKSAERPDQVSHVPTGLESGDGPTTSPSRGTEVSLHTIGLKPEVEGDSSHAVLVLPESQSGNFSAASAAEDATEGEPCTEKGILIESPKEDPPHRLRELFLQTGDMTKRVRGRRGSKATTKMCDGDKAQKWRNEVSMVSGLWAVRKGFYDATSSEAVDSVVDLLRELSPQKTEMPEWVQEAIFHGVDLGSAVCRKAAEDMRTEAGFKRFAAGLTLSEFNNMC